MPYTLKIDSFTFIVTPETVPQIDYNWKKSGAQISAKETWPLRCWFVDDDIDDLRAQWDAFLALIEAGGPKDVSFLLDGTPVDTLVGGVCNNGPQFINIHPVAKGGVFTNHIEFTMDVVGERAIKYNGIIDVSESEEVTTDKDGTQRNVKIKAVGNSARTFVLARLSSYSGNQVKLVERTDPWENSFEIDATLDVNKQVDDHGGGSAATSDGIPNTVHSLEERISFSDGLGAIRDYPIGLLGVDPYLIRGGRRATKVSCQGKVTAPANLVAFNGTRSGQANADARRPPKSLSGIKVFGQSAIALGLDKSAVSNNFSEPYVSEWAASRVPLMWAVDYSWEALVASAIKQGQLKNRV